MRLAGRAAMASATTAATATANAIVAPARAVPNETPGGICSTLPHGRPQCYGAGRETRMAPVLWLIEDVLANGADVACPAGARMIFVVHGSVTIGGRTLGDGEAWHGEQAAALRAGTAGATLWRWELLPDLPRRASRHAKSWPRAWRRCRWATCCGAATALRSRPAAVPIATATRAPASAA